MIKSNLLGASSVMLLVLTAPVFAASSATNAATGPRQESILKCPDTGMSFSRLDSVSRPLPGTASAVSMNTHTCFYGENEQYLIQLNFTSGSPDIACASADLNPKVAFEKLNLPADKFVQFYKPLMLQPPVQVKIFGIQFQNMPQQDAVKVARVYPGSVAEKEGVKLNDRIVAINGDANNSKNENAAMLAFSQSGNSAVVTVQRTLDDGKTTVQDIKLPKFKFFAPRTIILNSLNNLSSVKLEVPFKPGSEKEFKHWIELGKKLFKYSDDKAIACSLTT